MIRVGRKTKILAAILLIVVLGYGYAVWRHVANPPRVTHDYLADLTAPIAGTPVEQCAWLRYCDAMEKIKAIEQRRIKAGDLNDWWEIDPRRSLEDDQLVEFLAEIEPQLAQVREAAKLPVFGNLLAPRSAKPPVSEIGVYQDWGKNSLLVTRVFDSGECLPLVRCLTADAFAAFRQSNGQRVVDDLTTMLRLADQVREVPFLINDLVGLSTAGRTFQTWNILLSSDDDLFSDEQLRAVQKAIATFPKVPFFQFQGERALFDDFLQHVYTDDGQGDGVLYGDMSVLVEGGFKKYRSFGPWQMAIAPIVSRQWDSRRTAYENYHRLLNIAEQRMVVPLWMPIDDRYEQETQRINDTRSDPIAAVQAGGFVPANLRRRSELMTQQRDAVAAATAVVRFKRNHDRWPNTFSELVPDFLPSVPLDRYTGGPLSYRLVDDRPQIYSWGIDKDDDGGSPAKLARSEADSDFAVPHPDEPSNSDFVPWQWFQLNDETGIEGDWTLWPVTLAPLKPYDEYEKRFGTTETPTFDDAQTSP